MGLEQLIILLILGFIIFEPEDLPVVARSIGKIVYKFKMMTRELQREMEKAIESPQISGDNQPELAFDNEKTDNESDLFPYEEENKTNSQIQLEDLPKIIRQLCSEAVAQSISFQAITSNLEYRAIIELGDKALDKLLQLLRDTNSDGLEEYVIAMICSEIKTSNPSFDYPSGKTWYEEVGKYLH